MGDELAAENRASQVKAGERYLPRKDAPERGRRDTPVEVTSWNNLPLRLTAGGAKNDQR